MSKFFMLLFLVVASGSLAVTPDQCGIYRAQVRRLQNELEMARLRADQLRDQLRHVFTDSAVTSRSLAVRPDQCAAERELAAQLQADLARVRERAAQMEREMQHALHNGNPQTQTRPSQAPRPPQAMGGWAPAVYELGQSQVERAAQMEREMQHSLYNGNQQLQRRPSNMIPLQTQDGWAQAVYELGHAQQQRPPARPVRTT
jgi:hypothetical protein